MAAVPGRRAVRQPGLDELRLLTKVARLYHEKGIRQPQIAQQLRLSQARVSRMLKQAMVLGIVKTVVTMPPGVHGVLEDRLEALYGLRDVVVVDGGDADDIVAVLGSAAAAYLGVTLTEGPVVGITSWSESVLAAVERMTGRTVPNVDRVVQLLGGLGAPSGQVHANRLVAQFADMCGAAPVLLPAPGLVSDPSVKEALLRDVSVSKVMAVWDQITDAVVGIGGIEPSQLLLRSENGITAAERQELRALNAVGDICFRFFDADGALIESSLDNRVMGISAAQFFRIPRRIGVAGGEHKFDAVRAAARGGWINVLITDLVLAQRLVADAEPDSRLSAESFPLN
jgi:DNA-binding transcriptional regulator LsrR (DeoR family)